MRRMRSGDETRIRSTHKTIKGKVRARSNICSLYIGLLVQGERELDDPPPMQTAPPTLQLLF